LKDFEEVDCGLTPEEAIQEAGRCLQCKKPGCVDGCPVNIDIPAFVALIAREISWRLLQVSGSRIFFLQSAGVSARRKPSVKRSVSWERRRPLSG
jgi:Fe-S oxidoreductase